MTKMRTGATCIHLFQSQWLAGSRSFPQQYLIAALAWCFFVPGSTARDKIEVSVSAAPVVQLYGPPNAEKIFGEWKLPSTPALPSWSPSTHVPSRGAACTSRKWSLPAFELERFAVDIVRAGSEGSSVQPTIIRRMHLCLLFASVKLFSA